MDAKSNGVDKMSNVHEIQMLTQQNIALIVEIGSLKGELQALKTDNQILKVNIKSLNNENRQYHAEIQENERRITSLQQQLSRTCQRCSTRARA